MHKTLSRIDRSIKRLYRLDTGFRAGDFLLSAVTPDQKVGNRKCQGALVLVSDNIDDIQVGIYLHQEVHTILRDFSGWSDGMWTRDQLNAFAVAVEEISHFNFFTHHARAGRKVSELELEIQGEIDKFLITYWAQLKQGHTEKLFGSLVQQLFSEFSLRSHLSSEQVARYQDANRYAKNFLFKHHSLIEGQKWPRLVTELRKFYRLSTADKMSFLNS